MKKRRSAIGAVVSIAVFFSLSAEAAPLPSSAELLGAITAEMEAEGRVIRVSEGGEATLLPSLPAAAAFRAAIASEKPALLVEALFALPLSRASNGAEHEAELASIYGLLGCFETLEGIEYWSASRKTWRTFYAESYRVDGPETRRRLADPPAPKPGALPVSEEVIVFQRDLSFGANLYRYEFRVYNGAVSLESTNLNRMNYHLVPVLAAEALKTRLLVVQASDAILFYAASGADVPGIFRSKLQDSFGNRAEALFRWFEKESAGFLKSRR